MIDVNIDIIDNTITIDSQENYTPVKILPGDISYPNELRYRNYDSEVTLGSKSYLPDHFKETIREELVENEGYYNQAWDLILRSFKIDEEFMREIVEYIGIDFLSQYQDEFSLDFKRELEGNELGRL